MTVPAARMPGASEVLLIPLSELRDVVAAERYPIGELAATRITKTCPASASPVITATTTACGLPAATIGVFISRWPLWRHARLPRHRPGRRAAGANPRGL